MYKNRIIINTIKSSVLHFSLSVILCLQEESPAKQATLPAKQSAAIIQLSSSPTLQKAKRLRASISTQTSSKDLRETRCKNFAQHHVKSVNLRLNQHHHTPKVPSRGQFLQKNPLSSALRISESVTSACQLYHPISSSPSLPVSSSPSLLVSSSPSIPTIKPSSKNYANPPL